MADLEIPGFQSTPGSVSSNSGFSSVSTQNINDQDQITTTQTQAFSDASTGATFGQDFSLLDSQISGDINVVDPGAIPALQAVTQDALSLASLGVTGSIGAGQEAIDRAFDVAEDQVQTDLQKVIVPLAIIVGIIFAPKIAKAWRKA